MTVTLTCSLLQVERSNEITNFKLDIEGLSIVNMQRNIKLLNQKVKGHTQGQLIALSAILCDSHLVSHGQLERLVPTGSRSVFISTVAEMLKKRRDIILDQVVHSIGVTRTRSPRRNPSCCSGSYQDDS